MAKQGPSPRIVVTVPTFNEAQNIDELLEGLLSVHDRLEVVVVDDDSPDGTGDRVARWARHEPRLHLLRRHGEKGMGTARRDGLLWALGHGADVAVEMDADLSHDPVHLPALIEGLERGADVVLGSRLVAGGRDEGRSAWRVLLTRLSNLYARGVLGLPVRDCNSGYRAFRREVLRAIDLPSAFSTGPSIVHELLFKTHARGFRLAEVPITFRERKRGHSTLTLFTLLKGWGVILRLRWLQLTGHLLPAREPAPVSGRPVRSEVA